MNLGKIVSLCCCCDLNLDAKGCNCITNHVQSHCEAKVKLRWRYSLAELSALAKGICFNQDPITLVHYCCLLNFSFPLLPCSPLIWLKYLKEASLRVTRQSPAKESA